MKAGLFVTSFFIAALGSAGCVGEEPGRAFSNPSGANPEPAAEGGAHVLPSTGATDPLPPRDVSAVDGSVKTNVTNDAGVAVLPSKAAACSRTFGNALRVEYGRLDGIVSAVVKPSDTQCTQPLAHHVVIEVTMSGAVYRMLVETKYTNPPLGTDSRVRYHAYDSVFMPHGNWAEGWHAGYNLDYSSTLGIRAGMFNPVESADLVQKVSDEIKIGDKISVYVHATSGSSGQYVRRQTGEDGAILLRGDTGTPRVLAFYFDGQNF